MLETALGLSCNRSVQEHLEMENRDEALEKIKKVIKDLDNDERMKIISFLFRQSDAKVIELAKNEDIVILGLVRDLSGSNSLAGGIFKLAFFAGFAHSRIQGLPYSCSV